MLRKKLYRPRKGRLIAGVCAGVARRFDISVTTVRLVTVASIVLPGSQVLIYLGLWLLMPSEERLTYAVSP